MGYILASHFSRKKGIELFGDRAENTTTKELQQIDDMGTYEPQDIPKLSKQEKRDALKYLLFITEKKDGRIKSRKYAMGNKQHTYNGYDKSTGIVSAVLHRASYA